MFKYAIENGLIENNPGWKVKKAAEQSLEIFFDENDFKRLGKALRQSNYIDKYILNFVILLAVTKCRYNEIMALQWKCINFDMQIFCFPWYENQS